MIRVFSFVVCLFVSLQLNVQDAVSSPFHDPSELVKHFYDEKNPTVLWLDNAGDGSGILSKDLTRLYAASLRKHGGFALTFDPVVNGQDALINGLHVYPSLIDGNRALVSVRFRNFSIDNVLIYSFIRENGGWKLDEIASVGGGARWVLTGVLTNP